MAAQKQILYVFMGTWGVKQREAVKKAARLNFEIVIVVTIRQCSKAPQI